LQTLLIGFLIGFSAGAAPTSRSIADRLLAESNLGNIYVEDGAANGTVMTIGENPAVAAIVALGAKSEDAMT